MNSKKWLLNPTAIKAARICIKAVQEELGVKLTLSHPKFLELLRDYCELTESEKLKESYSQLIKLSDNGELLDDGAESVASEREQLQLSVAKQFLDKNSEVEEWVSYRGKKDPKRLDDKDFKGF